MSLATKCTGYAGSEPSLALPALKNLPAAGTVPARERPLSSPVSHARRAATAGAASSSAAAPMAQAPKLEDVDDELNRIMSTAPTIALTRSPSAKVPVARPEELEARAAARTAEGAPLGKQYAYTRKANGRVVLSKETMELEIKQMRSFNRDVYETRVRQNYLEEQVTRKLYTQKLGLQRHERLAKERVRQEERIRREFALGTPYLQAKARNAEHGALMEAARAASAPMFSDVQAIEQRLAAANLASRSVVPESRIAKPATVKELAVRAKNEVPPTHSLLNPRNQTTSPLPPKELLLPWMPGEGGGSGAGNAAPNAMQHGAAKGLLNLIPELFDAKRVADYDAERRGDVRPSLPVAVRAHLSRTCTPEVVAEKLAALRLACAMHSGVPRVAIFQSMIGWGEDLTPWDSTKAAACLLLMMWLQPPQDEATKVSKRFVSAEQSSLLYEDAVALELRLTDVDLILKHLARKRLVSSKGLRTLAQEAAKLELPAAGVGEVIREAPSVDVDQLLLKWMSIWGTWEWREDAELLHSVVHRFQVRSSPRKAASSGSPGGVKKPAHAWGASR